MFAEVGSDASLLSVRRPGRHWLEAMQTNGHADWCMTGAGCVGAHAE